MHMGRVLLASLEADKDIDIVEKTRLAQNFGGMEDRTAGASLEADKERVNRSSSELSTS